MRFPDGGESGLPTDPICGRPVDVATAFASEEHDGRWYYFDSRECQYEFLAAPHRYGHVHPPDDPRPEGRSFPIQTPVSRHWRSFSSSSEHTAHNVRVIGGVAKVTVTVPDSGPSN